MIVDGKSTDGTVEILSKNSGAITWWTSEPDAGIYEAWNKALPRARGDWLCFLGADDYLADKMALERMASQLAAICPPVRVAYARVQLVNDTGEILRYFGAPWPQTRKSFLAGNALNIHQATFHHRSLFERHGGFDQSFQIAGDYELLLRELKEHDAVYVPDIVAAMQHGGVSSSPATKMRTIEEIMRARRKNGVRGATVALQLALIRAKIHAALYRISGPRISGIVADGYRLMTGKRRLWTR